MRWPTDGHLQAAGLHRHARSHFCGRKIVSHQEFTDALLFDELVHVVQYAQMDMKEFAARFVNGFIQGGSYEEVPLEKMAHALEDRFSQNATQVFSVDDEIRQWREAEKI